MAEVNERAALIAGAGREKLRAWPADRPVVESPSTPACSPIRFGGAVPPAASAVGSTFRPPAPTGFGSGSTSKHPKRVEVGASDPAPRAFGLVWVSPSFRAANDWRHDACSTERLARTRIQDTAPAPRNAVDWRHGCPGLLDPRCFCLSTKHASPSSPGFAERAPCLGRSATGGRSHSNAGGVGFKHPRRGHAPPASPTPRPTARGQTADQAPAWVVGAAHAGFGSVALGTAW